MAIGLPPRPAGRRAPTAGRYRLSIVTVSYDATVTSLHPCDFRARIIQARESHGHWKQLVQHLPKKSPNAFESVEDTEVIPQIYANSRNAITE